MPTVTERQTFPTVVGEGALPKGALPIIYSKALLICWGYQWISFDTLLGEDGS